MIGTFDFSHLHHFLAFAESVSANKKIDSKLFSLEDGSYSSLIKVECQSSYKLLKTLKSLSRTISDLAHVVQEGVTLAEEELLPDIYGRGLGSLPFEIMERIFQLIHDNGCVDFAPYMLVSRHFRDTLKRASCLWTRIDDSRDPSIYLERSGSRPLHISLFGESSVNSSDRFLTAISPHHERWGSLSIAIDWEEESIDDPQGFAHTRLRRLRDEYRNKQFPSLKTLKVDYGNNVAVTGNRHHLVLLGKDDPNGSIRSFFSSWDMPTLHRVEATGFVPMLPSTCHNNITNFRFSFSDYDMDSRNVGILCDVLRDFRHLEELSLDIVHPQAMDYDLKPVHLPCLRSLEIVCGSVIPAPLINALDVPMLRDLDLCLEGIDMNVTELFKALIDTPFWMQLKTLHCSTSESPFHIIWENLPCLHHLSIETDGVPHTATPSIYRNDRRPPPPPPLRTLKFTNCRCITTPFVLALGQIINAPEFDTLEIIDCPNIDTDVIRKVIPNGKKLVCREYDWTSTVEEFRRAQDVYEAGRDLGSFF